jgi:hypothetical protein
MGFFSSVLGLRKLTDLFKKRSISKSLLFSDAVSVVFPVHNIGISSKYTSLIIAALMAKDRTRRQTQYSHFIMSMCRAN